jgi:hypothetical protein
VSRQGPIGVALRHEAAKKASNLIDKLFTSIVWCQSRPVNEV